MKGGSSALSGYDLDTKNMRATARSTFSRKGQNGGTHAPGPESNNTIADETFLSPALLSKLRGSAKKAAAAVWRILHYHRPTSYASASIHVPSSKSDDSQFTALPKSPETPLATEAPHVDEPIFMDLADEIRRTLPASFQVARKDTSCFKPPTGRVVRVPGVIRVTYDCGTLQQDPIRECASPQAVVDAVSKGVDVDAQEGILTGAQSCGGNKNIAPADPKDGQVSLFRAVDMFVSSSSPTAFQILLNSSETTEEVTISPPVCYGGDGSSAQNLCNTNLTLEQPKISRQGMDTDGLVNDNQEPPTHFRKEWENNVETITPEVLRAAKKALRH